MRKRLSYIILLFITPFILSACEEKVVTSDKINAYHDNSEVIGDEKDEMVADISHTIYESIDREQTQSDFITVQVIDKEGEEVQVPEGRYMISGIAAGTVTVRDKQGDILYETPLVSEGIGIGMVTLDLTEDHVIHVDGFEEAFIQPAEDLPPNELGAGIWEVGKDIEPGKYTAQGSEYGYLQLFQEEKSPKVYEFHGEHLQDPIHMELVAGQKIKITNMNFIFFEPQS